MTCNLTIDGKVNVSDINTTNETAINHTVNGLKDGTYNWSVTCRDNASTYNVNTSETYSFTVDTIPPQITITQPTDDTITNKNYTYINVTTTEANVDTVTLNWNGENKILNGSNGNYYVNKTDLSDRNYTFQVFINDTVGYENSTEERWIFINNNDFPDFAWITPSDSDNNTNVTLINLNVSVSNILPISSCFCEVNGTNNPATMQGSGTNVSCNYTISANGTYNVRFLANNTGNGSNYSSMMRVNIDLDAPAITIVSPSGGTLASDDFTLIFSDWTGLSCAWYQTNSSGINVTNCTISNNKWSGTFTDLLDGQRNVTVWANDTLGNENSTTRYWTRNTGSPLINITSPLNKTYLKRGMDYNLTNYGTVLSNSVNCSVDDNADFSMANATNRTYYNLSKAHPQLAEGQHDLTCHSNPAFNNTEDATRWFSIGIPPDRFENISIDPPGDIYLNQTVNISIAVLDASFNGKPENNISTVIMTYNPPGDLTIPANKTCIDSSSNNTWDCELADIQTPGTWLITDFYANDTLGNMNSTTTTLTFTVLEGTRPPTDPTDPGNGGGGGGGGGGSSCNTFTFTKISKGENKTASFKGEECKNFPHVSIIPKENLSYAKLTLNLYDKKPWYGMAEPDAIVNRYFKVSYDKDNYVESAKFKVSVNKSWLKANDIDPYKFSLYRYTTTWEELDTKILKEDSENIYFEVTTPGFSYFSLGGANGSGYKSIKEEVSLTEKKDAIASIQAEKSPVTIPPVDTPPQEPVKAPEVPSEEEKGGICGPTVVVLLAMLVLVFMRRRTSS